MNLYNLLEKNNIHLNKDIFHYGLFIMKNLRECNINRVSWGLSRKVCK